MHVIIIIIIIIKCHARHQSGVADSDTQMGGSRGVSHDERCQSRSTLGLGGGRACFAGGGTSFDLAAVQGAGAAALG